jgi:hypothetical protein
MHCLMRAGERDPHAMMCSSHQRKRRLKRGWVRAAGGAALEKSSEGGWKQLYVTAYGGHAEALQVLLVPGADTGVRTCEKLSSCISVGPHCDRSAAPASFTARAASNAARAAGGMVATVAAETAASCAPVSAAMASFVSMARCVAGRLRSASGVSSAA